MKRSYARREKCILRNVSNLSAGGECFDLTSKIHRDYVDLCIDIARDFNVNLCGIDIMCNNLCESMDDYILLELNSSPGLDNYAFCGEKQEKYVKELYQEVVLFINNKLCEEESKDRYS